MTHLIAHSKRRSNGRFLSNLLLAAAIGLSAGAAGSAVAKTQPTAVANTGTVTGYVLGPHDTISVIVYGQNEFNVKTRIKPDGSIVMPLIGKVQAQGHTVLTLADEVEKRLEKGGYLRSPIVNIEIAEYGSRYVRVAGNVGSPGLVPLDRSYGILDVLLRSGWVRGSDIIILRSADGKEQKLNSDALARGGAGSDIQLKPGDTIYVPEGELVYVVGQVGRPGPYHLKPGMTVSELLAQAGGVSATGSSNKFDLSRDGERQSKVDQTYVLKSGDIIHVRERIF